MYKIPISGGPHTGKTTLLKALEQAYPSAHFVPEPAERVIAREAERTAQEPGYEPVFPYPRSRYPAFVPLVIAESATLENGIPPEARLVFQDRSFVDNIGPGTMNEYTAAFPELRRRIAAARYAFAFFCAPVGTYAPTSIRHEPEAIAMDMHAHLREAYETSSIEIIHLPAVSVPERVAIVRHALQCMIQFELGESVESELRAQA